MVKVTMTSMAFAFFYIKSDNISYYLGFKQRGCVIVESIPSFKHIFFTYFWRSGSAVFYLTLDKIGCVTIMKIVALFKTNTLKKQKY